MFFESGTFIATVEIVFRDGHGFDKSVKFLYFGEVLLVTILVFERRVVTVETGVGVHAVGNIVDVLVEL